jgi:hypothetical protein
VTHYYVLDDDDGELIEISAEEASGRLCIMSEFDMNAPCEPIDRSSSDPLSGAAEA